MESNFNFKKILVPYNGTEGANRGLQAAVELSKITDGEITLIVCVENQSLLSFFKKNESFKKEKEIILNEIKKIENNLKIPLKNIIKKSSFAPETIVDHVEDNEVDLVVIGQTKIEKTESKYHQSMANYLTQGLKCPLMIVK